MTASNQEPTAKERLTGLTLIFIVAVIWIAASFVVQELPLHPFLLTYICNALFIVYLPLAGARKKSRLTENLPLAEQAPEGPQMDTGSDNQNSALNVSIERSEEVSWWRISAWRGMDYSSINWSLVRASCAIAPVWFFAALSFNISLHLTSVTSNTILSAPSSLFTFLLSVVVLHETFTYSKLTSVLLTVLGTVLVAMADRIVDESSDTRPGTAAHAVLGDMLTLLAAVFYACYTVMLKTWVPDSDGGEMMTFFGYMGVFNSVLFAPVLLTMQLVDSFNIFQVSRASISFALIKGLFDNVVGDYLWSRAVLLIGPTLATVGLQLSVPMAMVLDPLIISRGWWDSVGASTLELSGGACILGGFFWLNYAT